MIDPEAGVAISGDAVDSFGSIEGPRQGTGEGILASDATRRYAKLGQALMSLQQPQQAAQQVQGGGDNITSGFNFNWLAQQEAAGSAQGQKL